MQAYTISRSTTLSMRMSMYLKKLVCKSNMLHDYLFLCSTQVAVGAVDLITFSSTGQPVDSLPFRLLPQRSMAEGESRCLGSG